MKKTVLTILASMVATTALWLVLGAALPAPIWRNNFSTNEPPYPVIGTWFYSNANTITLTTNYLGFDENGITGYMGGSANWSLVGWSSGNNTVFNWNGGQSAFNTNGSGLFAVQDASVEPLRVLGKTGQGVPYFAVLDGAGNEVGTFRTNAFWATTNDFFSTLQTTDNTTNNIKTLTPRDNSMVRVKVDVVGYNSTASASYGKIGTFKSVAGTVTQVGATATVGQAEDDAVFECLLDTSANLIRVRVAGNTGRTVNWKCYLNTIYSE
jgi:hypothetical protein